VHALAQLRPVMDAVALAVGRRPEDMDLYSAMPLAESYG